jgi:coatomer subunit beta
MSASEASCYTIVFEDSSESPSTQELRAGLEKGTDEVKFDTLRRIIISTINGNHQVRGLSVVYALLFADDLHVQPQLLMPIIQYVLPSKHKALKKLLHFYWEVCPKYDDNGKLKQEMILVVWVACPILS